MALVPVSVLQGNDPSAIKAAEIHNRYELRAADWRRNRAAENVQRAQDLSNIQRDAEVKRADEDAEVSRMDYDLWLRNEQLEAALDDLKLDQLAVASEQNQRRGSIVDLVV